MDEKHEAPSIDLPYMPALLDGLSWLFFMLQAENREDKTITVNCLFTLSTYLDYLSKEAQKGIDELYAELRSNSKK